MDDRILQLLNQQLEERKTMLTGALVGGSAKDFAGYCSLVGEVRGLLAAQGFVEDLARKVRANADA